MRDDPPNSAAPSSTHPPHRRRLLILGVLALLAGLGAWWWLDGGRNLFFPKNWGVVADGAVFRSGRIHRRLIRDVLAEHDIQVVVDLAGTDVEDPNFQPEREAAQALGVEHHTFSRLNGHGIGALEDYLAAFEILLRARRAGKPILVHCGGGSERTGATFAWYRMLVDGWGGGRAWDEYMHYRGRPPRTDDLREFVNRHMPAVARRMQERGLLDVIPVPLPTFGPRPSGE